MEDSWIAALEQNPSQLVSPMNELTMTLLEHTIGVVYAIRGIPYLEVGFLFALLVAMVVLFLTEKLPVDLTAFIGLSLLVVTGLVKPEEAFLGFASPAVITMLSVFIVSAGLQYTGVAASLGNRINRVVGSREVPLIIAVMLVAGLLSAFMNNVAAAAVLLPAVVSLAQRAGLSASRLLMPLAFGSILGGTTTLVGTPPNLLTTQVLTEQGLSPFALFDFAPYGLALLAVGILFMTTVGRWLLPKGAVSMTETERADLAKVYGLGESLFCLRIPKVSALVGKTLVEAKLTSVLKVQVVSIERNGVEILEPKASETIQADDQLVVEGQRTDLEQLLRLQDVEFAPLGSVSIGVANSLVSAAVVRLGLDSPFCGKSLRELNLRQRIQVTVAGVWREDRVVVDGLGDLVLEPNDEMLAIGEVLAIHDLAARSDVYVVVEGSAALVRFRRELFVLQVPEGSAIAGTTMGEMQLRKHLGLTMIGVIHGQKTELIVSPKAVLAAGDQLLIAGRPGKIAHLIDLGHVEVADNLPRQQLESDEVGLVEVVVAPRSTADGQSLRSLGFRKRYGLRALAVWRKGSAIRNNLPDLPLKLGDALLLHGQRDKVTLLRANPDFVVLTPDPYVADRNHRSIYAIGALSLMVVLVVAGIFPIQVAAFFAATLAILSRTLRMREAYRAIEWRAIFLVAAILPVGIAMERSGATQLLATSVTQVAGDAGPFAVLAALMLLSSLLSQGLDGAPTVVLLGPVVVSTAANMGLSPYPLMMGVGLAASAAFMTPFSHKANLLVMGAGGYRSLDYLKVGAPLTVLVLGLLMLLIPWLMPFYPAP